MAHGLVWVVWIGSFMFLVDYGISCWYGRKFLSELNRASPILMEMGYWDIFLCAWAVFTVFSILAISMARSKNVGKGKASSSSMERASSRP